MNECDPMAHERLIGVPRICEACWSPIPWGQVSWRPIVGMSPPAWECLHTGCLPGNEKGAA